MKSIKILTIIKPRQRRHKACDYIKNYEEKSHDASVRRKFIKWKVYKVVKYKIRKVSANRVKRYSWYDLPDAGRKRSSLRIKGK